MDLKIVYCLKYIFTKRLGHAKEYVEMCWKVLQYKKPDDFVIATEKQYNVKFLLISVLSI